MLIIKALILGITIFFMASCQNNKALAESSFGPPDKNSSKASPASVISMGRDDDDGHAKKWHIGGAK